MILEAANSGNFDDKRRLPFKGGCMKCMMSSTFVARLMTYLAKNKPDMFLEKILLPTVANWNEEERKQEVAAMKNLPKHKLDKCLNQMGEAAWVFPIFPDSYDNYVKEQDHW